MTPDEDEQRYHVLTFHKRQVFDLEGLLDSAWRPGREVGKGNRKRKRGEVTQRIVAGCVYVSGSLVMEATMINTAGPSGRLLYGL